MLSPALVIAASLGHLLVLFAVAYWADWRGRQGRSVIANPWVYALSLAVYCTASTYFGSVGRAATGGVWFLPIYLGPTLAMVLGWLVVRKMIRIAKAYRITSIAGLGSLLAASLRARGRPHVVHRRRAQVRLGHVAEARGQRVGDGGDDVAGVAGAGVGGGQVLLQGAAA